MASSADATQLLAEGRRGCDDALDRLLPEVHSELKAIAHRMLQKRPANGALRTTALVNEAYLKLVDQSQAAWEDRAHFEALSARAMRQILVDHFRKQHADKRGGESVTLPLDDQMVPADARSDVMLALDEALADLSAHDARKAQIVMYRFYGGMTQRAIAQVLDVSPRTVRREWRKAKAWLARELSAVNGSG